MGPSLTMGAKIKDALKKLDFGMTRSMKRLEQLEDLRAEIDRDIEDLQIMYSKETFEYALKLFNIK